MELSICDDLYSNEFERDHYDFLNAVVEYVNERMEELHILFAGLCHYCNLRTCPITEMPLKRCGGCQLVSYCRKDCQKNDRSRHKYECREFPVVNGTNALYTTWSWKEHLIGLRERAARLPYAELGANTLFINPRVCNTCRETRPDHLIDCSCYCVSYCSRSCSLADKSHKENCNTLGLVAQAYKLRYIQDLSSVMNESVCKTFKPVSEWSDVISHNYIIENISFKTFIDQMLFDGNVNYKIMREHIRYHLATESLSYPMTLLYALQLLPERRLGCDHLPLESLTSLEVHVVTRNPLFNSEPWEIFMHRLPNLKELKVVFVMQGKALNPSFNLNNEFNLLRCHDCKFKNRVITYSIQRRQYHLFYCQPEYTEPDVVVVYGNTQEMSTTEKNDVSSEMSYCDMIHNQYTILVLTDVSKDLLMQGVKAVNNTQPVDQIVSNQINPLRGFSSNRADFFSESATINDKYYFTCLKRKWSHF